MHSWKDTLDYSSNTMDSALQYERFMNVSPREEALRSNPVGQGRDEGKACECGEPAGHFP